MVPVISDRVAFVEEGERSSFVKTVSDDDVEALLLETRDEQPCVGGWLAKSREADVMGREENENREGVGCASDCDQRSRKMIDMRGWSRERSSASRRGSCSCEC